MLTDEEQSDRAARHRAAGKEKRRQRQRIRLADVHRYRREGLVAESMKPLIAAAEDELGGILSDLGGAEHVSSMERALAEDCVRLSVILKAELARYLETRDPDAGRAVSTMASTRRATLQALGLKRRQRELTLDTYLDGL